MSRSIHPIKPIRDEALAAKFAKKFLGKFGVARRRTVKMPRSPNRSFTVYEIGTCSQIGEFVLRADSSHDFAEAFFKAGLPLDARDPLFVQDDLSFINRVAQTGYSEQIEMAV